MFDSAFDEPLDFAGRPTRRPPSSSCRLQSENNRLLNELLTANDANSRLDATVRRLQAETAELRQDMDDLTNRLAIAVRLSADAESSGIAAVQEERSLLAREVGDLRCALSAANERAGSLQSEIESMRRQNARAASQASELGEILSGASQCFGVLFAGADELLAFLAVRPHFDAQQRLEVGKLKEREAALGKKVRRQKEALKSADAEIARLKSGIEAAKNNSMARDQNYESQIARLNGEIKTLKKLHDRQMARIRAETRITEAARQRKPKFYLYREPVITIAGTKPPDARPQERLRDKVRIQKVEIRDLRGRKEVLEAETQKLRQTVSDSESKMQSLNTQLSAAHLRAAELERQLDVLRGTVAGDSKLKALWKRLRAAERGCLLAEREREIQQRTIQELTEALASSQDRLSRQTSEIQRLNCEPKPPIESGRARPIPDSISFSDCACIPQLPDELCPELNEITGNSSLQNSSKFRSVLGLLCSFYARKLSELTGRRNLAIERADQMANVFADFLSTCGSLLLNQPLSIDEFLTNPQLKSRLLAGLRAARQSRAALEQKVALFEATNDGLLTKVRRLKGRLRDVRDSSTELLRCSAQLQTQREQMDELEAATRRLVAEKNKLQEDLRMQRREFVAQLQAAKAESIGDCERIIDQLKRRCGEQRETIQSLSQQLAAAASGVA
jgi:chromosome segregation ATPase